MTLNDKVYNFLKFIAQVALPAVGAAYFALAQIWHLPKADELVGTVTVVDTFLGVLLGISTRSYNKTVGAPDGHLIVSEVDGEQYLSLGVNKSVDALASKEQVKLDVVTRPETLADTQ